MTCDLEELVQGRQRREGDVTCDQAKIYSRDFDGLVVEQTEGRYSWKLAGRPCRLGAARRVAGHYSGRKCGRACPAVLEAHTLCH